MNNLAKKIFWGATGVTVMQIILFAVSVYVNRMCVEEVGGALKLGCYVSKVVLFTVLLPAWGTWNTFRTSSMVLATTLTVLTIWVVNIIFTFLFSGGVLGLIHTIKHVGKKYKTRRK